MLTTNKDEIEAAVLRASVWLNSVPESQGDQAVKDKLLELAALLYHAPSDYQADYLRWIARSVLSMPMLVFACAIVDEDIGSDTQKGLRVEMTAYCSAGVAPALAPIISKLRNTADGFEKLLRETKLTGATLTIYDSDQKPAGQA